MSRGKILAEMSMAAAMDAATRLWRSGDRAGAAELFGEALGVQRSLMSGVDGLLEHGPEFLRWVDWPVQALLSQDERFAVQNRDYTAEAVDYARRLEDASGLAKALVHAGLAQWNTGDHRVAVAQFREAVSIQSGLVELTGRLDEYGLPLVRWVDWPIQALLSQEDHYAADNRDLTTAALGYANRLDDAALLARATINAGVAHWKTGDHVTAAKLFQSALAIQRRLVAGDAESRDHASTFVGWADWPVGALLSQDDRFAMDNRNIAQEAVEYARRLDEPAALASALVCSGIARWRIGESNTAAKLFQEAVEIQLTLMAAPGGMSEHGETFLRWVEWPIGALLGQDDRHRRFCAAIRAEAAKVTQTLAG